MSTNTCATLETDMADVASLRAVPTSTREYECFADVFSFHDVLDDEMNEYMIPIIP